jgi:hypothetical protein
VREEPHLARIEHKYPLGSKQKVAQVQVLLQNASFVLHRQLAADSQQQIHPDGLLASPVKDIQDGRRINHFLHDHRQSPVLRPSIE